MLKPSICNIFARPLTTFLPHFWTKYFFSCCFAPPFGDAFGGWRKRARKKSILPKNERAKLLKM